MTGRRSFVVGFAAALAATAAHAQENPDVVGLREQLMALEQQSWAYMKARDRAGMSRLLAEDALWIFADGTRYYKTDVLFGYMPNYRLDSYEIEPRFGLRVISPDAAVLLYRVTSRGAARLDRTETSKVLASSLYVRRGGKWWSLLYQETPLP